MDKQVNSQAEAAEQNTEAAKPKAEAVKPKAEAVKPKADAAKPKTDAAKPKVETANKPAKKKKKKNSLWKRYRALMQKFLFQCLKNGFSRANYLRKHDMLAGIGENVYFYSRIMPADPKLLKIHNNVSIATNVRFVNHDRIDLVLKGIYHKNYGKTYGCIEVMDNVFIGSDVIILPGVKIGPNAIVGAGSVVTKDVLPGTIVGGSPARPISDFKTFIEKRKKPVRPTGNPEKLWQQFEKKHVEAEKKIKAEAEKKAKAEAEKKAKAEVEKKIKAEAEKKAKAEAEKKAKAEAEEKAKAEAEKKTEAENKQK